LRAHYTRSCALRIVGNYDPVAARQLMTFLVNRQRLFTLQETSDSPNAIHAGVCVT